MSSYVNAYAEWAWEWMLEMTDEKILKQWREASLRYKANHKEQAQEGNKIAARKYRAKQIEENSEEFHAKRRDDVRRCRQRKKEELMKDPEAYAEFIRQRNEKLKAWRAKKKAEKLALEQAQSGPTKQNDTKQNSKE